MGPLSMLPALAAYERRKVSLDSAEAAVGRSNSRAKLNRKSIRRSTLNREVYFIWRKFCADAERALN